MIKWFKDLFKKKQISIKELPSNPPAYQDTLTAKAKKEENDYQIIIKTISLQIEDNIKAGNFICAIANIQLNYKIKIDKNEQVFICNMDRQHRSGSFYSYKTFKSAIKYFENRGFKLVLKIVDNHSGPSFYTEDVTKVRKILVVYLDWSKDATKHQS